MKPDCGTRVIQVGCFQIEICWLALTGTESIDTLSEGLHFMYNI